MIRAVEYLVLDPPNSGELHKRALFAKLAETGEGDESKTLMLTVQSTQQLPPQDPIEGVEVNIRNLLSTDTGERIAGEVINVVGMGYITMRLALDPEDKATAAIIQE